MLYADYVALHSELSLGCFIVVYSLWLFILGLYVSYRTEVSHVTNSNNNEYIATTHHSTLRLDNIQERQQSQQTAEYNSGSFDAPCEEMKK